MRVRMERLFNFTATVQTSEIQMARMHFRRQEETSAVLKFEQMKPRHSMLVVALAHSTILSRPKKAPNFAREAAATNLYGRGEGLQK